jgi:hypothetical protein
VLLPDSCILEVLLSTAAAPAVNSHVLVRGWVLLLYSCEHFLLFTATCRMLYDMGGVSYICLVTASAAAGD